MENSKIIKNDKTELFETMEIGKAVMKLSVPTIIGCLVMVIYNLADTYFVGMLNDPVQTSAVTLVGPVILAFNAVNNLFGTGTSSIISRALGLKDYELVKKCSAFGFYMAVISGIIFSVAVIGFRLPLLHLLGADAKTMAATSEYLKWTVMIGAVPAILNVVVSFMVRAEGSSFHASVGMMSGCILNIILDPFFILPFGLNMGSAGAGFATFISNCVACIYYMVFLIVKRGKTFICVDPKYFKPNKRVVKEVFSVGVPAAIQNLLNVTGMTVLNNLSSVYGTEAVAAIGISHKITMVPMYVSMGLGQGLMPLVGYNYAAGNIKRMKDGVLFTSKIAAVFMVIATALFYIFAGSIIQMFIQEPLTVQYGTAFIRGMSLAQIFLAIDFLGVGIFQACGHGGKTFIFAILRKGVLEIPALLILDKLFPMYGLAYAQLVAELILAIVSAYLVIKIINTPVKKSESE